MAFGHVRRDGGERIEPVLEPVEEIPRSEDPQPRRRQFERQRQPVEPAHDLSHDGSVVDGQIEGRLDLPGAVDEQLHGRRLADRPNGTRHVLGRHGEG